jgi:3-carboxy-cis,cis-muconate cycloisomerase
MASSLIDTLSTTDALAEVFSDASVLQAMLDVEAALARAEARAGVIPERAAEVIHAAARAEFFDAQVIAREARDSGTVAVPLVKALTARVQASDADCARFVHWGATSQDIVDSALVLLLRRARPIIAANHERLESTLRTLSDRHARTVMLGRTLLQPAPPITLGLKAAHWVAAIVRGWSRVDASFDDALVVQFGGASGTLAALGATGLDVQRLLAQDLGLAEPAGPWHTDRDRLAGLVTALAVYTASLAKIARDVSLLMQDEVAEAAEAGGGSSTMPHKRNPSGCAIVLAAATRLPGLAASFLTGMVQEHERAVGGWHAEWPTVSTAVQTSGAAVAALAGVASGLTVDPDRMRANIERTNGVIFAERVMMLTSASAGKESAQALVAAALKRSRDTGQSFREALSAQPDASQLLSREQLETIDVPEAYLGAAEALRVMLLS